MARATGEPAVFIVIGLAGGASIRSDAEQGTAGMDELIARVSQAASVDPQVAQQAIGEIFNFLKTEASPDALQDLMDKIPGAHDLAASMGEAEAPIGGGLLGALSGMMGGGGIMGLAGKLMGLGLGMGEMQTIGREVFAYARETAGEETVNKVTASVPALAQLV